MKAFITGAAGFVGSFLIDALLRENYEVFAAKLPNESIRQDKCKILDLDILDSGRVNTVIREVRPDVIFHLAAQSSVKLSKEKPALTIDVNINGTANLLEALNSLDYKPRVLLIGSSEEYGSVLESDNPLNEQMRTHPESIYAATKAYQTMLGKVCADTFGLDIVMVRAFNHTGPGQSETFVVSDFCKQAAEIEAGIRETVIYTGNLSVKRDFTDVRDVVKAYISLVNKGEKGEVYNVGSGKAVEISKILEMIVNSSIVKIKTEIDRTKLRPVDAPIIEADTQKIRECTGWVPEIALEVTVAQTLQFWRDEISKRKNI